jgi:hypothetical protein
MYVRCVLLCSYCLALINAFSMRYAPVAIKFSRSASPTAPVLFMSATLGSKCRNTGFGQSNFCKGKRKQRAARNRWSAY